MDSSSNISVRVEPWSRDPSLLDQLRRLDEQTFTQGTRIDLDTELERPYSRGWVAWSSTQKQLVGYLVTWHVADELHILNIATDPAARRQGVATALLDTAMTYARQHHVHLLLLEVRRNNRAAIGLYRGFGFFINGLRPHYYSDNHEDAIELMLTLDPNTGAPIPGVDDPPLQI